MDKQGYNIPSRQDFEKFMRSEFGVTTNLRGIQASIMEACWASWNAALAHSKKSAAPVRSDSFVVPIDMMERVLKTLERTANDTLDGRNCAFELRTLIDEVKNEQHD